MFKRIRRIHLVGIGGSGMAGIAEILLSLGYQISGSDLQVSEETQRLAQLGATVMIGHRPEHVEQAQVVVVTSAARPDNPEVVAAQARHIPVIPRAEMLAELARLKYSITIAGTHGKTTTTSLIALALEGGGLDPTVIIGGRLKGLGSGAQLGRGDYLVAEADESDGSFLKLSPTIAVVTNIDDDHLDFFKTMERLREAFLAYMNRVPFYGCAVVCHDDAEARALLPQVTRRTVTYGLQTPSDFMARRLERDGLGSRCEVVHRGQPLGQLHLRVPGQHNVLNALAAVAAAAELEVPFERAAAGLASFTGVGRRLEIKGEVGGIVVLDDYGHHPTEIRATLSAIREHWPNRRLVVLFQPHRFSRTRLLHQAFGPAFQVADVVRIMEIYPAGERPIPGVSAQLILQAVQASHPDAQLFTGANGLDGLQEMLRPGDLLLTLGAGDVWKVGVEVLARCRV
ncbi:MAG: UDP-N-acetylmuramate--L-alanine ligase [Elusimicrobia bacterium]|nr:UDP-N-acetylmuramate--L-alanine ligase [Elusimicrobiota bacterium]